METDTTVFDMFSIKIATARALIVIVKANRPLSRKEVGEEVAREYRKNYDKLFGPFGQRTLTDSLAHLIKLKWIDREFMPTPLGRLVYKRYEAEREGLAAHFWRKSNSPNVTPSTKTAEGDNPLTQKGVVPVHSLPLGDELRMMA